MLRTVIELAGETTQTDVRGASDTTYTLLPRIWLKTIVDAAKKDRIASQFAYQTDLQQKQESVVVPRRTKYLYSGTMVGEATDIVWTTMNNLSGIAVAPTEQNFGITFSNKAVRTNAIDLLRAAREELTEIVGDRVDIDVIDAMNNTVRSASGTAGSQDIYGGDAGDASTVTAGDVINTDMIAAARRKLKSTVCKYWTGGAEASSTATKNPWKSSPGEPFVLLLAPEQEETFLTDSQFINAAEYGSDKIIHNGEIGDYLGTKVVVSNNTKAYAASTTHADGTTTAVAQHRCAFFKSKKAAILAFGLKPRLVVFDWPSQLSKRLVIEQAYKAKPFYDDAIVHINVADE